MKPDYSQAACKGMDTHLFYPDIFGVHGERKIKVSECAKICAECPIQMDCLTHACETGEFWGVWGGVSERRRRILAETKNYEDWAVRKCISCSKKFMPNKEKQTTCGAVKCTNYYRNNKLKLSLTK